MRFFVVFPPLRRNTKAMSSSVMKLLAGDSNFGVRSGEILMAGNLNRANPACGKMMKMVMLTMNEVGAEEEKQQKTAW